MERINDKLIDERIDENSIRTIRLITGFDDYVKELISDERTETIRRFIRDNVSVDITSARSKTWHTK